MFVLADEELAEIRGPRQSQSERGKQRHTHSHGQRTEKCSGDSRNRNQGKKHNYGSDCRADQRNRDLLQCSMNGLQPSFTRIAMKHDVLYHHDRVIDDQAHRCGQPS